jgi:hypothetical protein
MRFIGAYLWALAVALGVEATLDCTLEFLVWNACTRLRRNVGVIPLSVFVLLSDIDWTRPDGKKHKETSVRVVGHGNIRPSHSSRAHSRKV